VNDAPKSFSVSIRSFGLGAVTKTGLGTLTLAGTLGFSSGLTVNAGAVVLGGDNTFSGGILIDSGGTVSVAAASNLGPSNAITLNGGTLLLTQSFASNNPIFLGANGGIIDVASAMTFTQQACFSGSTLFTKSGAGTLAFNSAQFVAAPLVIDQGRLLLSSNGTMSAAASFTVNNGGTLELDNTLLNN